MLENNYLQESVRRHLPLASNDDSDVHDHELIARVGVGGPPVGQEGGCVGGVVHIGHMAVRGELHQLCPGGHAVTSLMEHPKLKQWGVQHHCRCCQSSHDPRTHSGLLRTAAQPEKQRLKMGICIFKKISRC